MGGAAQGLRLQGLGPLGALEQAQQPHGHQARVVEIRALHALEQSRNGGRGPGPLIGQPTLHLLEVVAAHLGHRLGGTAAQLACVKPRGAAEGREQGLALLIRLVALGKAVEHLGQPHRKQSVGLKALLMAEQVQFHQQFIHQPPVQRGDHVREGGVKGPLAVGNGEADAHAEGGEVGRP